MEAAMLRYLDGDLEAFSALYQLLSSPLRGFIVNLGAPYDDAADLLQDSFLRIHSSRFTFRRGERVMPWAFTVARSVYFDSLRRRRSRPHEVPQRIELTDATDERTDPETLTAARQAAFAVTRIIEAMPSGQRAALESVLNGASHREAGLALGTTEMAVKLRVFRARRVLGSYLNDALVRG